MPDLTIENSHGRPETVVAGVDEAGRGPLAGPVVAAAVIIPSGALSPALAGRIDDSKALTARRRAELVPLICSQCDWAIGKADPGEIDQINILQASFLAMRRAVEGLAARPGLALIDGNRVPAEFPVRCVPVVGGDRRSLSIAAASILAKERRDEIMAVLDGRYPGYGWADNKGYPTKAHRDAIGRLGPTPEHRRTFRLTY